MSQEITLHAPQFDSQSQSFSISSLEDENGNFDDNQDKENSSDSDWLENSQIKFHWKDENIHEKNKSNSEKIKEENSKVWLKKIPARKTITKKKRKLPKSFFK